MLRKQIQLGLIHVAVAMTLVPINSTLNRVMIHEMAVSATLVAILASLPYLFSPLQVAIGAYSDRHPLMGLRRTPYIAVGLLLCVIGLGLSPQAAFLFERDPGVGLMALILAFGAWGMGYNLSSVSYLALASELSGEKGRGRTIAIMWFMMIVSIIITAILVSRLVDPYTPQAMQNAFWVVGVVALVLGVIGLAWLEAPSVDGAASAKEASMQEMIGAIRATPQAVLFFVYLLLLLAAILGQDVLLEPFAAEAFKLTVKETTRITSIWGGAVLVTILLAGALERRLARKTVAHMGNLTALAGFVVILLGGFLALQGLFYTGVVLLGAGTGLSTVANLALMFDLTLPGYTGIFIGAWGVSNAGSRLLGNLLAGVIRDILTGLTQNPILGYAGVFAIEALMLAVATYLLTRIEATRFKSELSAVERAALAE